MPEKYTDSGAKLSPCGTYRYRLWRRWAPGDPLAWIMLNPSVADALIDDPTIRRCVGFARSWGYGAIEVVNLFALRATNPKALRTHPEPVGPGNEGFLRVAVQSCPRTVAAWGAHGKILGMGDAVRALCVGKLWCLATNADGQPKHPLYVAGSATLSPLSRSRFTKGAR